MESVEEWVSFVEGLPALQLSASEFDPPQCLRASPYSFMPAQLSMEEVMSDDDYKKMQAVILHQQRRHGSLSSSTPGTPSPSKSVMTTPPHRLSASSHVAHSPQPSPRGSTSTSTTPTGGKTYSPAQRAQMLNSFPHRGSESESYDLPRRSSKHGIAPRGQRLSVQHAPQTLSSHPRQRPSSYHPSTSSPSPSQQPPQRPSTSSRPPPAQPQQHAPTVVAHPSTSSYTNMPNASPQQRQGLERPPLEPRRSSASSRPPPTTAENALTWLKSTLRRSSFYHGSITRDEAGALLAGKSPNTFLVRDGSSHHGVCITIVDVKDGAVAVRHFRVNIESNYMCQIHGHDTLFNDFFHLLTSYKQTPIKGTTAQCLYPLARREFR